MTQCYKDIDALKYFIQKKHHCCFRRRTKSPGFDKYNSTQYKYTAVGYIINYNLKVAPIPMGFDLLRSLKMAPMLSSSPFPTLPPERLRSLKTLFNNSSSPSGRGDPKSCLLNNWLQKLKNKELIPIVTDSTRELAFSYLDLGFKLFMAFKVNPIFCI